MHPNCRDAYDKCDITSTERHLRHYRIDKECDKSNNVTRPPNPKTTTQQQKKEGKFLFVARSNEWQTNRNHFILPHVHSCIIDGGFFCFWFGIENCIDRLHSCIYGRYGYRCGNLVDWNRKELRRWRVVANMRRCVAATQSQHAINEPNEERNPA